MMEASRGFPFVRRLECPGGVVIDPDAFREAWDAACAVERVDAEWAQDLANAELKAAYKAARKRLREANVAARGKPYPCGRCSEPGSPPGRIRAYRHILNGVCFKCGGTGWQPFRGFAVQANPEARERRRVKHETERSERLHRNLRPLLDACPEAAGVLIHYGPRAPFDVAKSVDEYVRDAAYALRELPEWYTLVARRGGRCVECQAPMNAGETIAWDAQEYRQYHVDCAPKPDRYLRDHATDEECRAFVGEHAPDDWRDDVARALGEAVPA